MQSEPAAGFVVERTMLSDGSVRLAVVGGVDAETSCELLDHLVDGIVPGGRLVVDLAAATEVDETGIAALAVADRLAQLHQATLEVVSCTGDTRWWPAGCRSPRSTRPDCAATAPRRPADPLFRDGGIAGF